MILLVETSHKLCSVAVCNEQGFLVYNQTDNQLLKHAETLPPMVQQAVEKFTITAVAISQGPGSYTGLRIGASLVQGFCYARNIPLIAVPTHLAIGWQACAQLQVEQVQCLLYAGRTEAYTATIQVNQLQDLQVQNQIYTQQYLDSLPTTQVYAGDCPQLMPQHTYYTIQPQAQWLAPVAAAKLQANIFQDIAYYTPLYAKEYLPGVSTKTK